VIKVVVDAANSVVSDLVDKVAEPLENHRLAKMTDPSNFLTLNLLNEMMQSHITYLTAACVTIINQLVSSSDDFMNNDLNSSVAELWGNDLYQHEEPLLSDESNRLSTLLRSLHRLWNSCLACKQSISHFILEGKRYRLCLFARYLSLLKF
jgi:hypothetical protein